MIKRRKNLTFRDILDSSFELNVWIDQVVEHLLCKPKALSSNPTFKNIDYNFEMLLLRHLLVHAVKYIDFGAPRRHCRYIHNSSGHKKEVNLHENCIDNE
jgi:hypothetical protein